MHWNYLINEWFIFYYFDVKTNTSFLISNYFGIYITKTSFLINYLILSYFARVRPEEGDFKKFGRKVMAALGKTKEQKNKTKNKKTIVE